MDTDSHTHNDNLCNAVSTSWDGTPWYQVPPPIKPLYEVVVMADYWYGYKAVDGSSPCAS